MVLEKLGDSLRAALRKIAGASYVDEALIKDIVRDIQRALLQADVNVKLALSITRELQRRALEEAPPAGMSPREHVVRIIYEELVRILGTAREVPIQKQKILLVGLYGQGKTTTAGKLGKYFQKKGLSVGFIAADVHRPAAYDQLEQLADQIKVGFYGDRKEKDAVRIVRAGLKALEGTDVLVVDSSGRHALEPDLIAEIVAVGKALGADERLLVIDATIGQQAGPQAKAFHDAVGVTGVIVTKLDGTAKGGGALSAVAEVRAPIVFVGVGEKIDDLERFEPPRFISRLLGMGDLESLLEKAQEAIDEKKAEELTRKIMAGKFTLHEMYEQIDMLTGMGPMQRIASLIPGVAGKVQDGEMENTQAKLRRFRVIMDSMTDEEMTDPKSVKASRVQRIARGAGVAPRDVKELLRHYEMSRKAIKGFAGNRKMRRQLLKQLADSGVDLGELEDK
ncbi:MAG: signal recognition particle [Euryarchaeota archaeon RBG_19FT_COMBO_69_17]|nr:MAG: signal recognition particle [Euryarchaeota archaeon RBG_19FT_COMBO_69_17]